LPYKSPFNTKKDRCRVKKAREHIKKKNTYIPGYWEFCNRNVEIVFDRKHWCDYKRICVSSVYLRKDMLN